LAGAVGGIILIAVIYLMPTGAAGLVRLMAARFTRVIGVRTIAGSQR
jgi:hypothetical protein